MRALLIAASFALASANAQSYPMLSNGTDSQSLFWGTYRPNLYFGLRPRLPESLMAGLMWFGTHDYQSFAQARHSCEQSDDLDGYTWVEHDPRVGGVQVLKDGKNNVILTTEWLKFPGGENGGSWAARIKGRPLDPSAISRNALTFYFGMEGLGGLSLENEESEHGLEGVVKLTGTSPDLGDFSIRIEDGPTNKPVTYGAHAEDFKEQFGKTQFLGIPAKSGTVWKAKDILMQNIVETGRAIAGTYGEGNAPDPSFVLKLSNEVYDSSNLYAFQKMFEGEFQFDVYFDSEGVESKPDAKSFTESIELFSKTFTNRFTETFPLAPDFPETYLLFSKAITSNLMGGIGYFYGTSIVDRSFTHEWDDEESFMAEEDREAKKAPELVAAKALLTATPSRSFFPRGFYWDEGFHLLIVGAWDNDLSLEIVKSWVDLIDDDGWVGREQILGEEARSKVPQEFQTQFPTYANPPTLTMALTAFIDRLRAQSDPLEAQLGFGDGQQLPFATPSSSTPASSNHLLTNPDAAREYLRSIYPALKRHFAWFRRTQKGQIRQWGRHPRSRTEAYRWRGRTEDHVLTSGLDDYPRAKPPHVGELHVDLISWVGFFSRTMRSIAEFMGEREDEMEYIAIEKGVLENIEDLHWNEEEKMYCDVSVDEDEESYHVCHKGYISLFPFLLGLLPPSSPHLGHILELVHSPDHLWSPYGIRSLSASHPLFGQGENYWRGPIWVQMNYLALSVLHKTYAAEPGPYQELAKTIYTELRMNIIKNVQKEYARTGYVWEQYDALTGEGKRSHPFTGWTSLVTLIIAEKY